MKHRSILEERYTMTTTNQQLNLSDVSAETLTKTLQAIIDHTTKTLASDPDPVYRTSCPLDTLLDGNYDDAWEAGQDNGELLEAKRIQDLILETLASS
jgi:hypothetical protein